MTPRPRARVARAALTASGVRVLAALVIATALGGCLVRYVVGPGLTGTCDGACAHYVDCSDRPDPRGTLRQACLAECPGVFADHESIMAFESLSCPDTVEFVEGSGYTEQDVKEAARAFTGWSVERDDFSYRFD